MPFKPPVSGLTKYLSKMKGISSDEVAGNKELCCLLDGGKLPQERHKSCQNAWGAPDDPPKERSGVFFFPTVIVIRGELFFLFKALINKASVVEPLWTFSMNVLGMVFTWNSSVADNYDTFTCSLRESDLWLDVSDRLNSGSTTNVLVFPYPLIIPKNRSVERRTKLTFVILLYCFLGFCIFCLVPVK